MSTVQVYVQPFYGPDCCQGFSLGLWVPAINWRQQSACTFNNSSILCLGVFWVRNTDSPVYKNTVAPLRVCVRSSTVGLRCRSQVIALFAILILTQTLTSLLFFGIGKYPWSRSIVSQLSLCLSRLSSSAAMPFLIWKGIRPASWATGEMIWSTYVQFDFTIFQLSNSYEQIQVLLN